MESTQSLQFCSILGPNSPLEHQKYCYKSNFRKNHILKNIKYCKTQVPEKSQNSYKIKQKRNIFWDRNWVYIAPCGRTEGLSEILT